jgi:hypothetical protein
MHRILILILLSAFILLFSCKIIHRTGADNTYYIKDFGYKISNYPGLNGIFYKVEIPDSVLYFFLLRNEDRLLVKYHGFIYTIDSIHFQQTTMNVDARDSTLVLVQPVNLWCYDKKFLDSLFRIADRELLIDIYDPVTNEKWKFMKTDGNINRKKKEWFRSVPKSWDISKWLME